MLEDLRELKDRRDELKSDRQREEPRWRELARILAARGSGICAR
jgi:hypothetical protein